MFVTCKYLTLLSFAKPTLQRDEGKIKLKVSLADSAPAPAVRQAYIQIILSV